MAMIQETGSSMQLFDRERLGKLADLPAKFGTILMKDRDWGVGP
jgi:hypothetical protein